MGRKKYHVRSGPSPRRRLRLMGVAVFALLVLGCGFLIARSIVTSGPPAAVSTTPSSEKLDVRWRPALRPEIHLRLGVLAELLRHRSRARYDPHA